MQNSSEKNFNKRKEKIMDITKIDGYKPEMTTEEKLALLESYEPDYTGYIKKDAFDKTASELAKIKKELNAKLTEDEQKEIERQAAEEAVKAELDLLRKEKTISESKAKFLGLGYDEALASETAEALAGGEMDKVFANQAKHLDNVRKATAAESLANESTPPAGKGEPTESQEANLFRKAAGLPIKE